MDKKSILKDLVVLANYLDSKGLIKEADDLTGVISKIAQDEYYDDSMRLDELNTAEDYNRYEEEQLAQDADRDREDEQALREELEDEERLHTEASWLSRLTKQAQSCGHEDYPCCGCGDDLLTPEQVQERMEAEEFEDYDGDEFEPVRKKQPIQTEWEGSTDTPLGEYYDDMTGDY